MGLFEGKYNDFYARLSRTGSQLNEQKFLSIERLQQQFENVMETLLNFKKGTENQSLILENIIKNKIAFANIIIASRETNNEKDREVDELFEKDEVIKLARAYEEKAEEIHKATEDLKKIKPVQYNEYRDLNFNEIVTSKEIESQYLQMLYTIDDKLDKLIEFGEINPNEVMELTVIFYNMRDSYKKLSNPETKREIDEKLVLNFNPNRTDLATETDFAEITYIPEKFKKKNQQSSESPILIAKNSQGDDIRIYRVGTLGFGKFRRRDGSITYQSPSAMEEYIIMKEYADPVLAEKRREKIKSGKGVTRWDDKKNLEMFLVRGHIDIANLVGKSVDPSYVKYNTDVLLSNANLETAIMYNGGYFGETRDGKKEVIHDKENLNLALEFEKVIKEEYGNRNKILTQPSRIALDKSKTETKTSPTGPNGGKPTFSDGPSGDDR